MAAFTVAGVLDTFAVVEEIDIAKVPGGTVGVGVGGLAPLMLGFLVTVAAVLSGGKGLRVDELAGVGGHERRKEMSVVAKVIVVLFGYLVAIGCAGGGCLICFAAGGDGSRRIHGDEEESKIQNARDEA